MAKDEGERVRYVNMHAGVSPTDHPAPLQLHPSLPEPEVRHVLVLDYIDSRTEALEQDILWISASGAARCRRASAVQVREGVLSPRGRRGHAARDNGNPLCQGCEDQLPLSRSAARVLEPSLTGVLLQAGPRGELAWRCPKNGSVLPCEFGPLCLSADSTRCQDSESLVQIQIEQTVPRQIQLPFWGPLFPALGGRSHAPPVRMYGKLSLDHDSGGKILH